MSDLPVLLSAHGEPVTLTTAQHLLHAAGIEDVAGADMEQLAGFVFGMKHWASLTREAQDIVNAELVDRRDKRASGTWKAGGYKVAVASKTAGTVAYDADDLRERLLGLVSDGVLDVSAIDDALEYVTPPPYYKVKARGVDGLLKLGGQVADVIKGCQTESEPPSRRAKVTRVELPR